MILLAALLSASVYAAPPTFSMAFSPTTIGPGSTTTLTYTIDNSAQSTTASDLNFSNTFPTGMTVATLSQASTDCIGSLSATAGSNTISLTGVRLAAGQTCTVTVDVTSGVPGTHTNTTGTLNSSAGSSGTASANLTVDASRPGFSMAFSPAAVAVGHRSTMTYTINNTLNGSNANFYSFNHTFPNGQLVDDFPNATHDCSFGSITATPGSNSVAVALNVNAGSSCNISVDVIRTNTNTLENLTGELSASGANPAGKASAELGLAIPNGLSLVTTFVGSPFTPGASETIRYTINNANRASADSISFSHDLNAVLTGMTATALPANGSCGSGSTVTGSSTIQFSGGQLAEAGSCSFEVTVLVPANAAAGTYSSTISDFQGDVSGSTVNSNSDSDLLIRKAPTLDMNILESQVKAGSDITIRYTITNTDAANSATGINFTQDINKTPFDGAVVKTLPSANSCGSGSTFTQSTPVELTTFFVKNAVLAAGANCSFDLIVTLAADMAPSTYELVSSLIQGTVSGTLLSGNTASDTVTIVSAPQLTASIIEDAVAPGGTATLTFTLYHSESAQSDATNISFTDDLNAALSGMASTTATQNDICGTGSSLSGTTTLTLSGATLSPDSSCTFSVTLQVPGAASPGLITNTTSTVSADVAGLSVSAPVASDTLVITGLTLSHSFVTNPAFPGDSIINRFTISNSASSPAATAIQFSYNLDQVITGMTSSALPTTPCGAGSAMTGPTNLSFSGGELAPGASCTFDVTVDIPVGAAVGSYNAITTNMSATVNSANTASNAASDVLTISGVDDSLFISKQFLSNNVVAGSTVDMQFTLTNTHATHAISSIAFTDDLDGLLSGLNSTSGILSDICGSGSEISGTGLLTFSGGTIAAGASCTFQVTLQLPGSIGVSSITNTTSTATGVINGNNISASPATAELAFLAVNGDELKITKSFQTANVVPGENVDLLFTITNTHASETITNIAFTDDLDSALSGLVSTSGTVSNVCRTGSKIEGTGTLSFSGGSLAAGASCAFSVTLKVPASATVNSATNTTSSITGSLAGISLTGTPASAALTLKQVQLTSSFRSNAAPGDTAILDFTIKNLSGSGIATSLNFSDDLDAFITGMTASGLPLNDVCGSGSTLSGSTTISLANGSLAGGDTCTFSVTLNIPSTTTGGVYSNTTSDLKSGSSVIGTAAIANLVVTTPSSGGSGGFSPTTTATVSSTDNPTQTATVSTTIQTIYDVSLESQPVDSSSGIEFPLGVVSFKMLTTVGGTESATITFSESLPTSKFFLYKVDTNGNKTLIPDSLWSQTGNSISIQLTDGGPFDLDGVENGIIVDPVTIGVPTEDELQAFEFAPWANVAFEQWIASDPVYIKGISQAVDVSVTGGLFSIDGGDYQSTAGSISLGQKLKVLVKSADSELSTTSATITVGTLSATFDVTTGSDEINQLLTHGNSCSSESVDWVQKAYIAYYGRPADTGGVNYWSCAMDVSGGSLSAIIDAFGNSREFTNQYGGLSNEQLIDAIYQQLFNRVAEDAGRAYWVEQLESGSMTLVNIAIAILTGALNDDLATVNNKLDVAKDFTYQTGASGVTTIDFYSILGTVTADPNSVSEVKDSIPTLVGLASSKEDNY